ncbi:hypothetical protein NXC24_PB00467 (plasmid) [Rhizobium sp. NXC24]|nr:hypothetical protein NXC24_PB00467 [Rhizobium sp. NXC24]
MNRRSKRRRNRLYCRTRTLRGDLAVFNASQTTFTLCFSCPIECFGERVQSRLYPATDWRSVTVSPTRTCCLGSRNSLTSLVFQRCFEWLRFVTFENARHFNFAPQPTFLTPQLSAHTRELRGIAI